MLRTRPIAAFILLAYGSTWLLMLPLLLQRRGLVSLGLPEAYEAVAAFGPCFAASCVLRANPHRPWLAPFIESLRRWPRTPEGLWLSVGSPLAFLAAALLFETWRTGGWPPLAEVAAHTFGNWAGIFEVVIVAALLQSLGEEPGWRGFLLARLRERHAALRATLLLFPAWLLWHLPMFLSRPSLGPGQFAGFALGILSAAIWLTAVRETTGSVPAAVIWHTLTNVTRALALAISMPAFLAYGMAVTIGAAFTALRLRRARGSP